MGTVSPTELNDHEFCVTMYGDCTTTRVEKLHFICHNCPTRVSAKMRRCNSATKVRQRCLACLETEMFAYTSNITQGAERLLNEIFPNRSADSSR